MAGYAARRLRSSWAGCAALLLVAVTLMDFGAAPAAFFGKKSKSQDIANRIRNAIPKKVRVRNFELSQKKAFPFVQFRQIPKFPISGYGANLAVDGSVDDFRGFPFSTKNEGSFSISLARPVKGQLSVSLTDPTQSASEDAEQQAGSVTYMQEVPGVGDISGTVRSSGDWSLGINRGIESLGDLSATVDSQFDWSVDLAKDYPAIKGFAPSVSYGANQDGMRVNVAVAKALDRQTSARYSVHNPAGKYGPGDFIHQGTLKFQTKSGQHAITADATVNTQFDKLPVRGSLTYLGKSKIGELQGSVDFDRYRLAARRGPLSLGASMATRKNEDGAQPIDLELQAGKVSAKASLLQGKPRVRVALGL